MTDAVGLRERKKAATKAALGEAAIKLAVDHGVDNVSLEAIAAEAGVSARTFHNYFPNKEAAILYDFGELAGTLVDTLRERAQRQPIWEALRDSFLDVYREMKITVDMMRCKEDLVKTSPTLIATQARYFTELRTAAMQIVADATETELSDVYPRLLTGSAIIATRAAHEHWLADPDGRPLEKVLTESFAVLEAGFAAAEYERTRKNAPS